MQNHISGMGVVSAIGMNVAENEKSLQENKSGIGPLTLLQTRHAVPCGEIKKSNEELVCLLGLPKKTYSRTALLGMMAAKEAMTDANIDPHKMRVGIISATSVGGMDLSEQYFEAEHNGKHGRLRYLFEHDCGASTERIATYLGITHFMTTISTACSSSANAIMLGDRMLRHNLLDAVLVGGTDSLCKFTINGFSSLQILDSEQCRPFDKDRAGLNLGEGAAFLVLQRESDKNANDYGRLLGYANANDAFHQTATSENGEGPYLAMTNALKKAGLETVDYINVHGTGTANNDKSEGNAMRRIWGDKIPPFSSTKVFTGHTLGACGAIESVYSLLMMKNGIIYPTFSFKQAETEGIAPVSNQQTGQNINTVLSNSFGFGGNVSSIILGK